MVRHITRQRGFTLYELFTTLAIGGVLMVGGTSLATALQSAAMTSSANDLITHLQYARSEAIKRHVKVSLCPSTDLATCTSPTGAHTLWQVGWIVYADSNNNGRPDVGEVLRTSAASPRLVIRSSRARSRVTYHPSGTAGGSTITFAVCNAANADLARYVVVSNTGRPRIANTTASDLRCS
jgi:type IV fimbrial biogenesis protein FimT